MKIMRKILFIVISVIIGLFFVAEFFVPDIFRTIFRPVYLPAARKIVQAGCKGPNKMFTTLGFSGSPFCANVFSDGEKSCDSGNECLSGICYLDFDNRKEFAEEQLGREAFYSGNSDFSLIIPPKSGICKQNSIPNCFSLGGSVKIENGKVIEVFPVCD